MSGWLILAVLGAIMLQACSDQPTPAPATTPAHTTATTTNPSVPIVAPTTQAVPTATPVPPTTTPQPKPPQPLSILIVLDFHQSLGSDKTGQNLVALPDLLEKSGGLPVAVSVSGGVLAQVDQSRGNQPQQVTALINKNAALLTPDDKLYMLTNFFNLPDAQIVRFPRFLELQRKRGTNLDKAALTKMLPYFNESDWRDLQVVYTLTQLPPDAIQKEPAHSVASKLAGFSEQDKAVLLGLQTQQTKTLLERYQQLEQSSQVEIVAAPYSDVPAPLLVNTDVARSLSTATTTRKFAYPTDLTGQLQRSQDAIKSKLGVTPSGVMPTGGLVSDESIPALQSGGAKWLIADETTLATSTGQTEFQRDDSGLVQSAGALYQAYAWAKNNQSASLFFADRKLSDQLSGGYAGKPAPESATDFVGRLKAIKPELAKEKVADSDPNVVTLVLDGSSAFAGYQDNGQPFLAELVKAIKAEPTLKLTTPSEFLKAHPATARLDKLSVAQTAFDPWIGNSNQVKAWTYLTQARAALDPALSAQADAAKRAKIQDWLFQAESGPLLQALGGSDLDLAANADQTLRANLTSALKEAGTTPPAFLNQPVTPALARAPSREQSGSVTPTVNGRVSDQDWEGAGIYLEDETASQSSETLTPTVTPLSPTPTPASGTSGTTNYLTATYFGSDNDNIYFRLDANRAWATIDPTPTVSFYLSDPAQKDESQLNFQGRNGKSLGFGAGYEVQIQIDASRSSAKASLATSNGGGTWQTRQTGVEPVYAIGQNLEIALPWKSFGKLTPGDQLYFTAILSKDTTDLQQVPGAGAGTLNVPDTLGLSQILAVQDKQGDDHGSGDYTYPIDNRVYKPGSFDLTNFVVAKDADKNLVVKLRIEGTLDNPGKAPNGFSLQTFDVYLHNPTSKEPGATTLLPGRNARVGTNEAWQYAIVAEGWQPTLYKAVKNGGTPVKTSVTLNLEVSPDKHTLTIRFPLNELDATDAENWSYLAAVLGTENDPTDSGLRVKDVDISATADHFGGAPTDPADTNHTRIIDLIGSTANGTQENQLNNYRSVTDPTTRLDPINLPLVYMLRGNRRVG